MKIKGYASMERFGSGCKVCKEGITVKRYMIASNLTEYAVLDRADWQKENFVPLTVNASHIATQYIKHGLNVLDGQCHMIYPD